MYVFACAIYDFHGTEENELRFKKGDIIVVKQEHPSGWWVGELFGRDGLFPANYVEVLKDRGNLPRRWPPAGLRSCTARYPYPGTDPADLNFEEGEVLVITDELMGWLIGENNFGKIGMFPKDFVTLNDRITLSSRA
jgi:E3 ubiquitin-protein ligase SH3RF